MDNATLKLFTDPHTVAEYAAQAVAVITGGEVDPLTAYVNMQKLKRAIDDAAKDATVSRSLTDYIGQRGDGKEGMTVGDCKAQVCEAGVTYDFSECGDPQLVDLYAEADALKERVKARENFLKGIDGHATIVDEATGEVATLYPPARSSKTTVKLTFKK